MNRESFLRLLRLKGSRRGPQLLAGPNGASDPILLNDGRYLRVTIHLTLDGDRLKVSQSSYQYQIDEAGERWIFRYDYLRYPGAQVPPAHLQLRGALTEVCLGRNKTLERVHFPTSRVSLEAICRMLIRDFGVTPNTIRDIWEPILDESEHAFFEIARKAVEETSQLKDEEGPALG